MTTPTSDRSTGSDSVTPPDNAPSEAGTPAERLGPIPTIGVPAVPGSAPVASGTRPDPALGARRTWVIAARVILSLAVLFATGYQLWRFNHDIPDYQSWNFVSYFTYQSAVISAVVLLGFALWPVRAATTHRAESVRGAAVVYMVTTGIVYAVLLSGDRTYDVYASQWWVNTLVHQLLPVAMVLDWWITPPGVRLSARRALWWLVYPLAFLAYSLVRGELVDWYPYGFTDPTGDGGWGKVAIYSAGITVGILVMGGLTVVLGNRLRRTAG
jgi:hypothetical protein